VPVNTAFDVSSQRQLQLSTTAAEPAVTANLSSVSKPAAPVQGGAQPFFQLSQTPGSSSLQSGTQTVSGPLKLGGQAQLASLLSGNMPQTTPPLFFGAQSQSSAAQHVQLPRTSSDANSKPSALSSLLFGTSSQQPLPVMSVLTQPSSAAAAPQLSAATKASSGHTVTAKMTNAGGISAGLPLSSDSFTFGKPISQSTPAHGGLKPQIPDMSTNKYSMQPGRVPLAAVPAAAAKMAANNAPASGHSTGNYFADM